MSPSPQANEITFENEIRTLRDIHNKLSTMVDKLQESYSEENCRAASALISELRIDAPGKIKEILSTRLPTEFRNPRDLEEKSELFLDYLAICLDAVNETVAKIPQVKKTKLIYWMVSVVSVIVVLWAVESLRVVMGVDRQTQYEREQKERRERAMREFPKIP